MEEPSTSTAAVTNGTNNAADTFDGTSNHIAPPPSLHHNDRSRSFGGHDSNSLNLAEPMAT